MVRTPNRLTDRFGIGRIVLVALEIGLHVLRWHQPHFLTQLGKFTCPIVRRGTGVYNRNLTPDIVVMKPAKGLCVNR